MVLAGNFEQKLQAIVSDAPYKYYGASEIMACNSCLKLPASTIPISTQEGAYNRVCVRCEPTDIFGLVVIIMMIIIIVM